MSSEDDSTTSTGSKNFYIGCSGNGYISIGEERLEELLGMMPTLRFLLFGHPNMKQNNPKILKNGTQVLEIPNELQVSKTSFLLLVNCIFQVEPLPRRLVNNGIGGTRMDKLIETMTTLGGCATLEERLREHSYSNPLFPDEDVQERFHWLTLRKKSYLSVCMYDHDNFVKAGFHYVSTDPQKDENDVLTHYYRKEKKPVTTSRANKGSRNRG